ncbi:MAG: AmmeMemoRadiSam system radical SAM enzyme [Kiritimatiellae bacterium]|nr:AmmeMemoRadiSam system radical SAM enzyme [Kiritimatiellia bacterium]
MSDATEAVCGTCPRRCRLANGAFGFCRARRMERGRVVAANYGRISSLALDPIEKKPIAFFRPGSNVLSVGSFGCNLRCPFCQNDGISQHGGDEVPCRTATPADLADLAARLRDEQGNIGLAYTYNEPLVGWEFVRDCALEVRARGMCNVLVSNGCANEEIVAGLAPLVDAANIDLKGPSQEYYDWIGGDFNAVCRTVRTLHAAGCHVEVTTLVVPGRNDTDADMEAIAAFVASVSPDMPLHVTRFFPCWRMAGASPTPVATVWRLADVARRRLRRVLVGNCPAE